MGHMTNRNRVTHTAAGLPHVHGSDETLDKGEDAVYSHPIAVHVTDTPTPFFGGVA